MVSNNELQRFVEDLRNQLEQYQVSTDKRFAEEAMITRQLLVASMNEQFQLNNTQLINMFRQDMDSRFSDLDARMPKTPIPEAASDKSPDGEQVLSTFHKKFRSEKGNTSQERVDDPDLIRRETRFQFPRHDCPNFNGENPTEWLRKCNTYFALHQIPHVYKTQLSTIQFHGVASEWYDGYLLEHDPPDWSILVQLVLKRFRMPTARTALEDWKLMHQLTSVRDYFEQFEKLRTRLVLEGWQFSPTDYVDAFICGLKGELKPFVKLFKPVTVEEALEYALYVEEANECQFKKFKSVPRVPFTINSVPLKQNTKKFPALMGKKPAPMINKNLIEQRRALGQCFKCGDKYFPGH
jgi:Retrotransposon gag protein